MGEMPLPIHINSLQIVIGIDRSITWGSVTDFKVHHLIRSLVNQVIRVASACGETGAHAGRESDSTLIGKECRFSLQYVYELILLGVGMPQRRDRIRRQASEIYAEIAEPKVITELSFFPSGHARCEWFWIVRWRRTWWHFIGGYGHRTSFILHNNLRNDKYHIYPLSEKQHAMLGWIVWRYCFSSILFSRRARSVPGLSCWQ